MNGAPEGGKGRGNEYYAAIKVQTCNRHQRCFLFSITALLSKHSGASIVLVVPALALSGFIADGVTGLAHFGFDYALSYRVPVFGPIALELNEHHAEPSLDPSTYVENFTKGAFASLAATAPALAMWRALPQTELSFFFEAHLACLAFWGFFFHQIHAYAHMGSTVAPETFNRQIVEIGLMSSRAEQMRALRQLFDAVPIPKLVRKLQRCHIILSPERHNLHHISFELNFSSVNGWSDPFLNPLLGRWARMYKTRRETTQSISRRERLMAGSS